MGEADFCVLRWQWDMIITREIIKATSKGSKIYLPITVGHLCSAIIKDGNLLRSTVKMN